jgi:hypothetical protein
VAGQRRGTLPRSRSISRATSCSVNSGSARRDLTAAEIMDRGDNTDVSTKADNASSAQMNANDAGIVRIASNAGIPGLYRARPSMKHVDGRGPRREQDWTHYPLAACLGASYGGAAAPAAPFPSCMFRRARGGSMLIACWSAKGGSGTTVVAASLGILLAERGLGGALIADLAGDIPAVLGLPDSSSPGIAGWLAAGATADTLDRLALDVAPGLRLLPRGAGAMPDGGSDGLVAVLARGVADGAPFGHVTVADCGSLTSEPAVALASQASLSLLVLRPCYLALRRALVAPIRPTAVILVDEEYRALHGRDIEDVLGVPIRATVPFDPVVARVVDAGLLSSRLPRVLKMSLRRAA